MGTPTAMLCLEGMSQAVKWHAKEIILQPEKTFYILARVWDQWCVQYLTCYLTVINNFETQSTAILVHDLCRKVENMAALQNVNSASSTVKLPPILSRRLPKLCLLQSHTLLKKHKLRLQRSFSGDHQTEVENRLW